MKALLKVVSGKGEILSSEPEEAMMRKVAWAIAAGVVGAFGGGVIVSLYWEFGKNIPPCPFCQWIRFAYVGGTLGCLYLTLKRMLLPSFAWGITTGTVAATISLVVILTQCLPCLRKQYNIPYVLGLSSYHLVLLSSGAICLTSLAGVFLLREKRS